MSHDDESKTGKDRSATVISFDEAKKKLRPDEVSEKELMEEAKKNLVRATISAAQADWPCIVVTVTPEGLQVNTTLDQTETHFLLAIAQRVMLDAGYEVPSAPPETPLH